MFDNYTMVSNFVRSIVQSAGFRKIHSQEVKKVHVLSPPTLFIYSPPIENTYLNSPKIFTLVYYLINIIFLII